MSWHWTSPLGGWRSAWLWRLFGLCVLLSFLHALGGFGSDVPWEVVPYSVYLNAAAALFMIVFGPTLLRLLLLAACLSLYLIPVMSEWVWFQLSEEFGLFLALPLLGLMFGLVSRARGADPEEEDRMQVLLFRWTVILVLAFACLHKINADFLNSEVSCGVLLPRLLPQWWAIPFPKMIFQAPPLISAILEGLIPLFLVLFPVAGMLLAYAFLGLVGMIGPAPFTLTVMTCVSAFFSETDAETLSKRLFQFRWHFTGLMTALLIFSWKTYRGPQWWVELALYQSAVLFLFFCVFLAAGHAQSPLHRWLGGLRLWPAARFSQMLLVCVLIGGTLNGLAPYLGWKYRLSFAMLSNLRADQTRWNSFVFPKALYRREFDPFIRIVRLEMPPPEQAKMRALSDPYHQAVYPGLFSPMSLWDRLATLREAGIHCDMTLAYRAEERLFRDAAFNEELQQWLAAKPHNKWFQEWLTLRGPQLCIH